jgi:hypothetical protein
MGFLQRLFGLEKKKEQDVIPKPYIDNTKKRSTSIEDLLQTQEVKYDTTVTSFETDPPLKEKEVGVVKPVVVAQKFSPPSTWMTFEKNGKEGYEDENGNIVIDAIFDEAGMFENDRAVVKVKDKEGMIDTSGNYILQPEYTSVYDVKEGMVLFEKDDLYGFADPSGKIVIAPQYEFANDFFEGLSCVCKDYTGWIDKNNRVVIDYNFSDGGDFCEGLAYASPRAGEDEDDSKYGFIDKSGKFVVKPQFDDAQDFSEGLAAVELDGKWGYTDKNGTVVIQPAWHSVEQFHEGMACVQQEAEGEWGYIDTSGKLVIDYRFKYSSDFRKDGTAYVFIGTKSYRLLKNGEFKKVGS